MSHVVSIRTELRDLDAVRAAATELGMTFVANQKTYKWWGASVGDHPLPTGFKAEDLGKCDHALKVPGTTWEVGIAQARNADGTRKPGCFTLLFDFFGTQGQPILKALGGEDARKFTQLYGVHKTLIEARKRGLLARRQVGKNGSVQVVLTQA